MTTIYFDIYENISKHFVVVKMKNQLDKFEGYPFKIIISDSSVNDDIEFDKNLLMQHIIAKFNKLEIIIDKIVAGFIIITSSKSIYDIMRIIAESGCDKLKQFNGQLCYDSRFEQNFEKIIQQYTKDELEDKITSEYSFKFISFNKNNLSAKCFALLPKTFFIKY